MTITGTTTHPNGVTFQPTAPYRVVYMPGARLVLREKREQRGVLITYKCGTKRWIGASWYDYEV